MNEHTQAARRLASEFEPLRKLRRSVGDPLLEPRAPSAFHALSRAIVHQQLASAAAGTIFRRLLLATGTPLNKHRVEACSDEQLRGAGLSAAKLLSLRDLAHQAPQLKLSTLHHLSDAEIVERLIQVRGIGRWTAEMFLIFQLRRLDVWPTSDLGVREGARRMFGQVHRPTEKQLEEWGQRFVPYRSVAAWYMWRATEQPEEFFHGTVVLGC